MPKLTRAASLAPSSFNEKTREIEIVVSTENRVARGSFDEVLSHDESAVDLVRFVGAPFLNSHKSGDARDVLGVVTAARIEGRKLIAKVKLSRRPDAEPIIQDVLDGITIGASAGYTVQQWRDDPAKGGRPTRTATKWRPLEVSLTPIPADSGAHVRKAPSWNPNLKIRRVSRLKTKTTSPKRALRFDASSGKLVAHPNKRTN